MTTSDRSKAWHFALPQTAPLYACQIADEQAALTTGNLNGAGFNKFDAPILSDIAAQSRRYGSLTPPRLGYCSESSPSAPRSSPRWACSTS